MPPPTEGVWSAAVPFPIPDPILDDGFGHTLTDDRGLFVLHAVLLKTGKVLCFCGHVEASFYAPTSYLFNPASPAAVMSPIDFPTNMDLFCCHYVQIPDGRILVVGGSEKDYQHHGSTGAKNIAIFDPDTELWSQAMTGGVPNELTEGRWYPTPVLLPDGRVFVASGRPDHTAGTRIAASVEILSPPDWSTTELLGAALELPIYPGLHLAPNGRIYFTHTTWGQEIPDPGGLWIEVPPNGTTAGWTPHSNLPDMERREEAMSVLLPLIPPAYEGRILVVGGGRALDINGHPTVLNPIGAAAAYDHVELFTDPNSAEILDTTVNPPTWSDAPGSPMDDGRTCGHCVLLPDATVLVCGGHDGYKWQATTGMPVGTIPSLRAAIFKPGTGFTNVASMHVPRMYHSVALLLPDGRVMCAGGADPNRGEPVLPWPADWGGPGPHPHPRRYPARAPAPGSTLGYTGMPLNDKTYELYEPPYCFNGARPVIGGITFNGTPRTQFEYGQRFNIQTAQGNSIDRVAIMRPGAPTHHTDTEQRYVGLEFTKTATELTVTMVDNKNVAPPGFYMLWIIATGAPNGLPCTKAEFIHLVERIPVTRPPDTPDSKCSFLGLMLSVNAGAVLYLQTLRERIAATSALGNTFIRAVNRIYRFISPKVMRFVENRPRAGVAVRECILEPAAHIIAATDRITHRLPERVRSAALISLLAMEGIAGIAAAPLLVAAVGAHVAGGRIRGGEHG